MRVVLTVALATAMGSAVAEGRLAWNVVLETHAGDLRPLSVDARARLHASDGRALDVRLAFVVSADSAHHPAGRIVAALSDVELSRLRTTEAGREVLGFYVALHDVGGATERRFAWSLPLGTEHAAMRAYVANAGDGTISVIDRDALEEVARWTVGTEASHGLALLRDGGTLYAGTGEEGDVVALDTRDGTQMRRVRGSVNAHGIDRTPDGRCVFVGAGGTNDAAHLLRIDTRSGDPTHVTDGLDPVGHIDVTPDGGTVFVANWISSDVSVVDAESLEVTGTLRVGEGTHGVAVTPDGGEVWITSRISNDVAILDPRTGGLVARMEAGAYANHASFTLDGRRALVTNARSDELTIFDVAGRSVVTTIPVGVEPHEIAIGPAPAPISGGATAGTK